jgi:hypothetical protein
MRNKQNKTFHWVAMVIVVVLAIAECAGAFVLVTRVADSVTTMHWSPAGNAYGR